MKVRNNNQKGIYKDVINQNKVILKLNRFFLYFRSFIPFLLSHHPECKKFENHTINFGKTRFCIGCFIGYPSGVIGIIILFFTNLAFVIPFQIQIIIGILMLSFFVLGPLKLITSKKHKIFQKMIIGFGGAFLFWGIKSMPYQLYLRNLTIYCIFGGIISLLNSYHAYGFFSKCHKCESPFNWGRCSGFTSIQKNFEKYIY